tara:strand:+ start:312 stop:554 length:243 start_codon:yes stop_codon:yes gene_type:complete
MTDPELKIRDLLLMDWTEEQRKKLRDWLKQKAKKLNEDENQTCSEPDETSSASEGSQGKREILVPPGYTLEEWNRIGDLY